MGEPSTKNDGFKTFKRNNKQSTASYSISDQNKGLKKFNVIYPEKPPRPQKRHMEERPSGNYDLDSNFGIKPFDINNLQTKTEHTLEKRMIRKHSNKELMDRRNGLPLRA